MVRACWLRPGGVRIPPSQARALRRLASAQGALFSTLGRDPHAAELADYLNMPHQAVNELLRVQTLHVSPLHLLPRDDDGAIAEEQWPAVAAQFAQDVPDEQRSLLLQALERALDYLPSQERIVVQLRYGFLDGAARTYAEAAADLGVSPTVIEDLDRRALLHLRKLLAPYAPSCSRKASADALSA